MAKTEQLTKNKPRYNRFVQDQKPILKSVISMVVIVCWSGKTTAVDAHSRLLLKVIWYQLSTNVTPVLAVHLVL